jgi:hypothetical protein
MSTQMDGVHRALHTGRLPMAGAQDEVTLRHLRTPSQIRAVLHLREEIDLSVHAAVASNFAELEKKETYAGSSAPLS